VVELNCSFIANQRLVKVLNQSELYKIFPSIFYNKNLMNLPVMIVDFDQNGFQIALVELFKCNIFHSVATTQEFGTSHGGLINTIFKKKTQITNAIITNFCFILL